MSTYQHKSLKDKSTFPNIVNLLSFNSPQLCCGGVSLGKSTYLNRTLSEFYGFSHIFLQFYTYLSTFLDRIKTYKFLRIQPYLSTVLYISFYSFSHIFLQFWTCQMPLTNRKITIFFYPNIINKICRFIYKQQQILP